MALREIDTELLVMSLIDEGDGSREIVFRNLSKRACKVIVDDLAEKSGRIPADKIKTAKELFCGLLEKFDSLVGKEVPETTGLLPVIESRSAEGLIESFCSLATFVRKYGYGDLEKIEKIDHPVMQKGVRLLVDGFDPMVIKSILENYRQSYLAVEAMKVDMIVEGIESLCYKDYPGVVEEKLTAHRIRG